MHKFTTIRMWLIRQSSLHCFRKIKSKELSLTKSTLSLLLRARRRSYSARSSREQRPSSKTFNISVSSQSLKMTMKRK